MTWDGKKSNDPDLEQLAAAFVALVFVVAPFILMWALIYHFGTR